MNMVAAFRDQLTMQRGSVVNLGSVMSFIGAPRQTAYAAAKGGIVNLTRVMPAELAPAVRVNAVAPGWSKPR